MPLARASVCQVPGCSADLEVEGDVSAKLKMCKRHRYADVVHLKDGQARFCQQCAKAHPLEDFDGAKRGCRKRLERHNLRRVSKRQRQKARRLVENAVSTLHATSDLPPILQDLLQGDKSESDGLQTAPRGASDRTHRLSSASSQILADDFTSRADASPTSAGALDNPMHVSWGCSSNDGMTSSALFQRRSSMNSALKMSSNSETFDFLDELIDGDRDVFTWQESTSTDYLQTAQKHHTSFGWSLYNSFGLPVNQNENDFRCSVSKTFPDLSPMCPFDGLESHVYHMDLKMNGATPVDLPFDLHDRLLGCHSVLPSSTMGTIRPGCVHLSVDFKFSKAEDYEAAARDFSRQFIAQLNNDDQTQVPWCRYDSQLIVSDASIKIGAWGTGIMVQNLVSRPRLLNSVWATAANSITLILSNLLPSPVVILCRMGGMQHELEVVAEDRNEGTATVTVLLPPGATGVCWLEILQECEAGISLSLPSPLLILEIEDVASELSHLCLRDANITYAQFLCFLEDIGSIFSGAESNSVEKFGTCACRAARLGLVRTLEEILDEAHFLGIPPEDMLQSGNILEQAILSRSEEVVKHLLTFYYDSNVLANPCDVCHKTGLSMIQLAAKTRCKKVLIALLGACVMENCLRVANRQLEDLVAQPTSNLPAASSTTQANVSNRCASLQWTLPSLRHCAILSSSHLWLLVVLVACVVVASLDPSIESLITCSFAALLAVLLCWAEVNAGRHLMNKLSVVAKSAGVVLLPCMLPEDDAVLKNYYDHLCSNTSLMSQYIAVSLMCALAAGFGVSVHNSTPATLLSLGAIMILGAMRIWSLTNKKYRRMQYFNSVLDIVMVYSHGLPAMLAASQRDPRIANMVPTFATKSTMLQYTVAAIAYCCVIVVIRVFLNPVPIEVASVQRVAHTASVLSCHVIIASGLRSCGVKMYNHIEGSLILSHVISSSAWYLARRQIEYNRMYGFLSRSASAKSA